MFYKRAVIAYEHNQQCRVALQVIQRPDLPRQWLPELELWGAEADGNAGGLRPGRAHLEPPPTTAPPAGRRRGEGPVRPAAAGEGEEYWAG